jgi:hypothetical protein
LRFRLAGDCSWHRKQRRVPTRDTFFVCDTDLELDPHILVKVVETSKDGL